MELKVTDLRKEYDGNIILNDISFVLNAGQKVGLVGYNGTGKTTLLKILSNEMKGDGGKVQFRKGVTIGYVPQDTRIASEQNVRQYLSSDENNIADYKMERILNGLDLSEVELNTYLNYDKRQKSNNTKFNNAYVIRIIKKIFGKNSDSSS